MARITTVEQLEALYGRPNEASTVKDADHVTPQYRAFIEAAPFFALASFLARSMARLFDARPHWGKLFTMAPAVLHQRYEKLEDFKKMVAQFDPTGKFENDFLALNL